MDYEQVIKENKLLKEENDLLKEKLTKYLSQHKNYYENNKEIVNEKAKQRLKIFINSLLNIFILLLKYLTSWVFFFDEIIT
jgi:hypothetical protein